MVFERGKGIEKGLTFMLIYDMTSYVNNPSILNYTFFYEIIKQVMYIGKASRPSTMLRESTATQES